MLPSQPAEEQIQTVTSTPMEAISVDLGKRAGVHYLIGADRYSGWPFVTKLSSLVTKAITDALDSWFLEHGRPQRIWSDGGPYSLLQLEPTFGGFPYKMPYFRVVETYLNVVQNPPFFSQMLV